MIRASRKMAHVVSVEDVGMILELTRLTSSQDVRYVTANHSTCTVNTRTHSGQGCSPVSYR